MKTRLFASICPVSPATSWHSHIPARGRKFARWLMIFFFSFIFSLAAKAQSLVYQGLLNTPLGSATLTLSGNQLTVGNLGGSGNDGVLVTTAGAQDYDNVDVNFQPLDDANTLPPGAYLRSQIIGTANGITNGVLGTITVTKAGTGNYVVSADYSPLGATNYTVQAYYQGILVAQATSPTGENLATASSLYVSAGPGFFDRPPCSPPGPPCPEDQVLIGGVSVSCDHLYVTPGTPISWTGIFGNQGDGGFLAGEQITASQVPEITITSENPSLVHQGLTNTSLGNATLAVSGNQLTVGNLGSSGQDGVSIALPGDSMALDVNFQPLDSSNTLPVGAYVRSQSIGTANGITNGVLGTLTESKAGTSNYVISADYLPLGASSYTVQVYYQGVLMAQSTNQSGAAFASVNIMGRGKDVGDIITPLSDEMGEGPPGVLTLAGGTTSVPYDRLVVTPDNVTNPMVLMAFQIVASQVPSITITSENESLIYQGLTNTSLGNATLNEVRPIDRSGDLAISNLGTNGRDGVEFDVGSQSDLGLHADYETPQGVGTMTITALGYGAEGQPDQPVGRETIVFDGTNGTHAYDFSSVGGSTYTLEIFNGSQLVYESFHNSGSGYSRPTGIKLEPLPMDDTEVTPINNPDNSVLQPLHCIVDSAAVAAPFDVGGQIVIGDLAVAIPENPTDVVAAVSGIRIQAGGAISNLIIASESLTKGNLQATALGNAVFEPSVADLTLSNLGANGQDGVSFALPSYLTALDVGWDDLDPSNALPIGAYIQSQLVGTENGITNGVLGTLTETKAGTSNYVISADFSPVGAKTYMVQAYYQGILVAQATNQSGASLAVAENLARTGDVVVQNPEGGEVSVDGPMSVKVAGQMMTCDRLEIGPENVTFPNAPTAFQIVASKIPSITITSENESLIYDGFTNTSLGQASVFKQDFGPQTPLGRGSLTLADLGTNGQDGVSISCDAGSQCQWNSTVAFQALDSSNTLPVGAYIQSQAIGIGNGITNGVLGTLTETKAGTGNYWISADYSPLGAKSYTVQAYYQGALMAQSTNQNGLAFGTVNIMGQGKDMGDIITPLSDEWPDGEGVILTIRGLAGVPCDDLVVTPDNVITPIISTALQIVASQIPVITITNETLNVIYQGQNDTALGNATLDVSSNQLTVSNIGGSGQDGVSIEDTKNISDAAAKGQATDREIHLNPPDGGSTLPVSAYMQAQLVGTGGGVTNGVLGTLTVTKECAVCGGSNYLVSVDFSPIGASNYLVEATTGIVSPPPRGDTPASDDNPFPLVDWTQFAGAVGDSGDFPQSFGYSYDPITGEFSISIDFEPYGAVSADGTNVVCDHLYITPQNVSLPFAPIGLQLVASQIPSFTITSENETVPYAGLYFTSLGNATLNVSSNQLIVADIGSNGQDGVAGWIGIFGNEGDGGFPTVGAAKGQAQDAMLLFGRDLIGNGVTPTGAYMEEQLIGTGNRVTNDVLGTMTVTKTGTTDYGITADFSPTGQSAYEVDDSSNSTQLESFQWGAANGIISTTTNFPDFLGFNFASASNTPSLVLDWGTNSADLSGNGTVVVCNHLSVTPDNVSLSGAPTEFRITASQVPSFTITSVAASPLFISPEFVYKWWVNKRMPMVWFGTATLQESTDLTKWTDVTNATSPYAAAPDASAKFYRLESTP